MPNSTPDDDALIRSVGRIPIIRAQLASRTWPDLAELSQNERDVALDRMALRDYHAERSALLTGQS
jgi:hypothetical protein